MPPRSDWEQRARAALMLCDQSWTAVSNGSTGDLRQAEASEASASTWQAAQYAVDAWGGVLMRGHDCCVLWGRSGRLKQSCFLLDSRLAAPYCYAQTIDVFDFSIPVLVLLFVGLLALRLPRLR